MHTHTHIHLLLFFFLHLCDFHDFSAFISIQYTVLMIITRFTDIYMYILHRTIEFSIIRHSTHLVNESGITLPYKAFCLSNNPVRMI